MKNNKTIIIQGKNMFFVKIIIPCIIATLLLFLLYFKELYFKNEIKNINNIKKRTPLIIGMINICIIPIFGIWYLFNVVIFPETNSLKAMIQIFSPIAFILVFFPVSIASIIILNILKNKNILDKKLFYYGLIINIVASILLVSIASYIFTKLSKWF
jgi:hypothetical protein